MYVAPARGHAQQCHIGSEVRISAQYYSADELCSMSVQCLSAVCRWQRVVDKKAGGEGVGLGGPPVVVAVSSLARPARQ